MVSRWFIAWIMTLVCCSGLSARGGEGHWAYQTPRRYPLPEIAPAARVREPLDAFILAELRKHRLEASNEADRRTLLRRLSLVLHGLPPTPDEVERFVTDDAPDAYEQQVDRLLASPFYGQRMATDWLDLARYADTHGYHADTEREQWRWRDWVIEQLNAGQPFDQFTIEQLAGDLLPSATLSQRMATGFNRNHRLNSENGAIPEEFLAESAIDRVVTTGSVWLGQTFVCARCHDHKYEALTQREFYGLVGIFNSLVETPLLVLNSPVEPRLRAPTREQQTELDQLAFRLAATQSELQERAKSAAADQLSWEKQAARGKLNSPPADAAVHLPLDGAVKDRTPNVSRPDAFARILGEADFTLANFGQSLLGNGATRLDLPHWPVLNESNSWTLSAWIYRTTPDEFPLVAQFDDVLYSRGLEWSIVEGRVQLRLTQQRDSDELIVRSKQSVPLQRWNHLGLVFDPKRPGEVQFTLNGQQLETEKTGKLPAAGFSASSPLRIGGLDASHCFRGMLDDVRLYARALNGSELQLLAGGNPLADIIQIPPEKRTAEQQQTLARYYLEHHDPEYRKLSDTLQALRARRELLLKTVPSVTVMQELPKPRPTFVFANGQYDQPGERVGRQTPLFLSQQAKLLQTDRLGFARWLVDPQHPLTARVAVNRAWEQVFGAGLVTTPDDFGVRGAKPSHPELLDWLAREWVDRGWDPKRLHRQLVSSATFRQRSEFTPTTAAVDPTNRWLARYSRQRLSAEAIRDSALQAAGLLNAAHGGHGDRPYQPGDLWKELSYYPNDFSAQLYSQSNGASLYRRSVYLFWKRNSPPVNLTTFDAPNRDTCTVTRSRTNTPLQALVLLNDPTFVEAARVLATRVLSGEASSATTRIDQLFLHVVSRPATATEQEILQRQLAGDLVFYRANPAEATKLIRVGQAQAPRELSSVELAAWTNLATVVLNLDEAISNN